MTLELSAEDLARRLPDPSAQAIAADLIVMIRRGDIPVGTKLPPVRQLAKLLKVSPSTVSAALQTLRSRNMLEGRGRSGITVVRAPDTPRPERYEAGGRTLPELRLDLSRSAPDRELLPDLRAALFQASSSSPINSYDRDLITPSLERQVSRTWPYQPRKLMAASGGYDGLRLCLHTFVREGDWVLVENPSPPRLLDLVDATEARAFALEQDEQGALPSALERGLERNPAAIILQPGIHNPSGRIRTSERREALANILKGTSALVIEDDGSGALFGDPLYPLAERIDCPYLYVRSYSKSHGPDLRLAVIEGEEELLAKVQAYFGYGAGWVSRPLQDALAWMLKEPAVQERVADARDTYHERRTALWKSLRSYGLELREGTGLDIMIPVRDAGYAEGLLAANGIAILRGTAFQQNQNRDWIRVSTSTLPVEQAEEVAKLLIQAAQ